MAFAWLGFALLSAHGVAQVASTLIAMLRLRRRPSRLATEPPPITLIRPACGTEYGFAETMGSSFALRHKAVQILFCVESELDPAVPLLRQMIADHPEVDAQLLIGRDAISTNPKLNNIAKGWHAASAEWIAIADSNVILPPDYVDGLFEIWDDKTGVISHLGVGSEADGPAAEIECAFLNALQARWLLAGDSIGVSFPIGKSLLFRRSIVDRAGGLSALATETVAEDIAATKMCWRLRLRPRIARRPLVRPVGHVRLGEVWRRQLRWAKIRHNGFPLYYWGEAFLGAFIPAIAALLLTLGGHLPVAAALGYFVAWYGLEAILSRRAGWWLTLRTPLAWIVRDFMIPLIWVAGFFGREIEWRGNAIALAGPRRGGTTG